VSSLLDLDALLRVAWSSMLASVGLVLLFSVAVATSDLAAGDRPGGDASAAVRLLGRSGAVAALSLCAVGLVAGLLVMVRK
jgi:hypothetical protein